jgi:hypothetical protein
MNRYAIIKDNKVINVIIWDGKSKWNGPEGTQIVQSNTLNIGDNYSEK